jgi:hypothetical protein
MLVGILGKFEISIEGRQRSFRYATCHCLLRPPQTRPRVSLTELAVIYGWATSKLRSAAEAMCLNHRQLNVSLDWVARIRMAAVRLCRLCAYKRSTKPLSFRLKSSRIQSRMSDLMAVLTLHVGNRNCSRWYDLRAQYNGIVCVFEKNNRYCLYRMLGYIE